MKVTALSGVEASAHTCSPRSRPEQAACCPNKSAELGCSPRTPSQKSDLKKNPNLLSRWYLFSVKWKRNFTSIFAVPHTAILPYARAGRAGSRVGSGPSPVPRGRSLSAERRGGVGNATGGVCVRWRVYGTDYGSAATPSMIAVVRVAEPVYHYRLYYGYGPRTAL